MGSCASGTLFWGYCWDEERSVPWQTSDEDDSDLNDDTDWEVRYARIRGYLPPSTPYPSRQVTPTAKNGYRTTPEEYTADEQAVIDQYTEFWGQKRKCASASWCIVESHGYEGSTPFVAIRDSIVRVSEGDSTEVMNLTVGTDWEAKLEEFSRVMKITPPGKAAWWLVSYYG